MLPPAQRRNASVRGGDCHRDARAVHEAVQLGRRSCGANRRGNEGIFTTGRNVTALSSAPPPNSPLTVKLSGRPQARPARRERRIAKRARGAQPPTRHGPLQRLLDRTSTTPIEQVE